MIFRLRFVYVIILECTKCMDRILSVIKTILYHYCKYLLNMYILRGARHTMNWFTEQKFRNYLHLSHTYPFFIVDWNCFTFQSGFEDRCKECNVNDNSTKASTNWELYCGLDAFACLNCLSYLCCYFFIFHLVISSESTLAIHQ